MQVLLAGRIEQAWRGMRYRRACRRGRRQALGETVDHLLHHRHAADRIDAVDISAEFGGAAPHHRLRHEHRRRIGQAAHARDRAHDAIELVGVDRDGGDAIFGFERDRVGRDRRRAGAAMADADDRGMTVGADFVPQSRIVAAIITAQGHELRGDAGHLVGEPGHHLLQQLGRVIEAAVDQIDGLTVEPFEPGGEILLIDPWREANRVEHGQQRLSGRTLQRHGNGHHSVLSRQIGAGLKISFIINHCQTDDRHSLPYLPFAVGGLDVRHGR